MASEVLDLATFLDEEHQLRDDGEGLHVESEDPDEIEETTSTDGRTDNDCGHECDSDYVVAFDGIKEGFGIVLVAVQNHHDQHNADQCAEYFHRMIEPVTTGIFWQKSTV
jgi:hypothetical protein